ncbi:hypothetical protein [Microbacterium sp. 18062]|uniref:hypothetical protein n=1 Tax=Microbacterium sp. 18062 TaxID=2681410 RepID=UPI0035A1615C
MVSDKAWLAAHVRARRPTLWAGIVSAASGFLALLPFPVPVVIVGVLASWRSCRSPCRLSSLASWSLPSSFWCWFSTALVSAAKPRTRYRNGIMAEVRIRRPCRL